MSTVNRARTLHEQGDLAGAYRVLGNAGDTYAAAAMAIVDGKDDHLETSVKRLWERILPGAAPKHWKNVARNHQRQYLDIIAQYGGRLPNTLEIENSYATALSKENLPETLAIDIVQNTAADALALLPKWHTILQLESGRVSSESLKLKGIRPEQAPGLVLDIGIPTALETLSGRDFGDKARYYPTKDGVVRVFWNKSIPGLPSRDYPALQQWFTFDGKGLPVLIGETDGVRVYRPHEWAAQRPERRTEGAPQQRKIAQAAPRLKMLEPDETPVAVVVPSEGKHKEQTVTMRAGTEIVGRGGERTTIRRYMEADGYRLDKAFGAFRAPGAPDRELRWFDWRDSGRPYDPKLKLDVPPRMVLPE